MVRVIACLALLALSGRPAAAQTTQSRPPTRGWVDINVVSLQSGQQEQGYGLADTIFLERRTFGTVYPKLPRVAGIGLDVGFHLTPRLAAGINFTGVNYDYDVALAIEVPHLVLRNRFATDLDVTEELLRREDRAVDLSLMFIPATPGPWRVRLFGGPTYFRVKQETVSNIVYEQTFNLVGFNAVDIREYDAEKPEAAAWRIHAGVDVGYYFSRHVGIGGVVRFNRGTVTIDEPLSGDAVSLRADHTTVGAGLRLRF